MGAERTRRLLELTATLPGLTAVRHPGDPRVTGIAADTRALRPGRVFVAIPGTAADGHAYIRDAVERGAAAIVAERPPDGDVPVPTFVVEDSRTAFAELAAAWHDRPADRIPLVGITGSLGKTSTLSMLEAVLDAAGLCVGTIGSLGIRLGAKVESSRLTTPAPLTLHRALARFAAAAADLAAMEVTSHALVQRRIHGLAYQLGIFTNLVPLEHREYHGSFRRYVEAKMRFFDHLVPGAPLIYAVGDRVVRSLVRARDVHPVSCGPRGRVSVRIERLVLERGGTRVVVAVRAALPRVGGAVVAPVSIPLELRVLGRPNITNAVLAAGAGLCLGAAPDAVRDALSRFPAPWRRMQIVHRGRITVLDDTVGHPDSIGAVFEVAERIPHRRLRLVYAVRGRRGEEINRRDAETVAIWARRTGLATIVVTASEDETDDANRVSAAELEAFLGELRRYGIPCEYRDGLAAAVGRVLDAADPGDLVLLLGAQGMDRGAELMRERVG